MTTASKVQATEHDIELRGVRLHYRDWGNEGATPLVLIHGLTSSSASFARVADHFAERFHVIGLDQRGHGDSEWVGAEGYGTDEYVADLEAFVDALGLQQFVLMGHSMGGHHTIAYTARHAERIICAVANDIPPALERDVEASKAQYPGGRHPVQPSVDAWIEQQRPNAPFTPEHMHQLNAEAKLKAVEGGFVPKHDPQASIHWAPKDLWDEARTIKRPILFVRGGRSTVLDAQTLQDMDLQIAPARSITLEKSGHNTFYDMEPEFLHVVSDFIDAHLETTDEAPRG
ncbi:MAG: alpha/beta hydrolase [Dehalococcoidia bacterium]